MVEFERAVNDCVATHKALQVRSCALAEDRQQAMRKAEMLTLAGQNGWLGFTDFEAGMNKELTRLRGDAQAAQERLDCFTTQVAEFGWATAKPEPHSDSGPPPDTADKSVALETTSAAIPGPSENATAKPAILHRRRPQTCSPDCREIVIGSGLPAKMKPFLRSPVFSWSNTFSNSPASLRMSWNSTRRSRRDTPGRRHSGM
jgi:hypothetical protein